MGPALTAREASAQTVTIMRLLSRPAPSAGLKPTTKKVLAPNSKLPVFRPQAAPLSEPKTPAMDAAGTLTLNRNYSYGAGALPLIRKSRVWVISSRVFAQRLPGAPGKTKEWACFTESNPPDFHKDYRVLRGSEARQIDLEEDESLGMDPKVATKLRPGERFNSRELQKKYAADLKPMVVTPAECARMLGARQ